GPIDDLLPVCVELHAGLSFEELVAEVAAERNASYLHRLPFATLLERYSGAHSTAQAPVAQVQFRFREPAHPPAADGLKFEPIEIGRELTNFDLDLCVRPDAEGGLELALHFRLDLFTQETAQRWLRHFNTLMEAAVASPDAPISDLPVMSEAEQQVLLEEWNRTEEDYDRFACAHQLFEKQAQLSPDRIAACYQDRSLTYRELNRCANRLAKQLIEKGASGLIGLYCERSLEMLIGALAIWKAGAAYVPMDPFYPSERIGFMVEDSDCRLVLTQQRWKDRLPACSAEAFVIDGCADAGEEAANPEVSRSPKELAYVIFTSGSTGRPKGVQIEHRALVNFLAGMAKCPGMRSSDRLLAVTSLSFDIAGLELYLPLMCGGTVDICPVEVLSDGRRLSGYLDRSRPTVMQATPATWRMLLQSGWQGSPSMRALCGGEALPSELAEALCSKVEALFNLYGPTETTIWSTVEKVEAGTRISIGRPIGNTRLYILDRYGKPVPVGVSGELHIGGEGLARGYLNRADLTAEKFIADPFADAGSRMYRTGDLARYLPDGRVECLGRLDQQVKVRGFRIELGEIESLLARYPGIKQAAVTAAESPAGSGDKRLIAYLAVAEGAKVSASDLRAYLQNSLPDYMLPSAYITLESLPLTPNGKLNRKALPADETDSLAGPHSFIAPRDEMETRMLALWQELLPGKQIGVTDDFFDLGGHSLLAVQLFVQIERRFGRDLPIAALFQARNIQGLAALLREPHAEALPRGAVPIQVASGRPPLFCVHSIYGHVIGYMPLARSLGPDQPVYGLEAPGINGDEEPLDDIPGLARRHVESIRAVQAQGPYHLCGECAGGLVALEIAQQLIDAGEQVAFLGLIDTFVHQKQQAATSSRRGLKSLYKLDRHLGEFLIWGVPRGFSFLCKLLTQRLQRMLNPSFIDEDIGNGLLKPEDAKRVHDAIRVAMKGYTIGTYPGRLSAFVTREASCRSGQDGRLRWGEVASGGASINLYSGDHYTRLSEPCVRELAELMRRSMINAAARPEAEVAPRMPVTAA
ncbi:MAG TPA: amino acid adenylation domain-containing protein, partial [Chthonomonadales bacterium]|nr:amino acid adenylation domain-containing protein [Chthonomonadales bacterium]